jgi:hypothetical protein
MTNQDTSRNRSFDGLLWARRLRRAGVANDTLRSITTSASATKSSTDGDSAERDRHGTPDRFDAGRRLATITGADFQGGAEVRLGDSAVTAWVLDSATIAISTTAQAAGTVDVIVTNPGGLESRLPAATPTHRPTPSISTATGWPMPVPSTTRTRDSPSETKCSSASRAARPGLWRSRRSHPCIMASFHFSGTTGYGRTYTSRRPDSFEAYASHFPSSELVGAASDCLREIRRVRDSHAATNLNGVAASFAVEIHHLKTSKFTT